MLWFCHVRPVPSYRVLAGCRNPAGLPSIHAAQYLTELPPQEVLEQKLLDAIHLARERLARQAQESMPAPRLPEMKKAPPPAAGSEMNCRHDGFCWREKETSGCWASSTACGNWAVPRRLIEDEKDAATS